MIFVSIDLETTGLEPARDQVLEIGAIAYDAAQHREVGVFNRVLKYDRLEGSPFALYLNRALLQRMTSGTEAVPPEIAWEQFVTWLRRWTTPEQPRVTAAGKNFASFDSQFIRYATFGKYGKLFHHRTLDLVTLWTDPVLDAVPPDTAECCRRAGLPDAVTHAALDDCRQVIALLEKGWARLISRMTGRATIIRDPLEIGA